MTAFSGLAYGLRGLWRCEGCGSTRMADARPETHPILVERRMPRTDGLVTVQTLYACSAACEAMIRLAPEAVDDG